jgi:SAM-dependent methyltransferase
MYIRHFDPAGRDSLARIARWVRPGSQVLELGPAAGYFTAHLHEAGCTVDAVEIDPDAAREAGRHARTVVVGDLAQPDALQPLAGRQYDAIICADVLEHVVDGVGLLRRLRGFLVPAGELLLSVPNVAHSAVIAELLDERFDYGPEGLLDATHVHLYTRRSIARALHDAGFRIDAWDAVNVGLYGTEFRSRVENQSEAVARCLAGRPNGHVYQWLLRATPGSPEASVEAPAFAGNESVPVRVLHADTPEALTLDDAASGTLRCGAAAAPIDIALPVPAACVRVVLADRIGVVGIADLELFAAGERVWALSAGGAHRASAGARRIDGLRWALIEPDAWIEPLPEATARPVDRVRLTATWPVAAPRSATFATFEALARAAADADARTVRESDALKAQVAERDALLESAREQLHAVEAARAEMEALVHTARREIEVARAETAAVAEELVAARQEHAAALAASRDALDRLRADHEAALVALREEHARVDAYRHSFRWWLRLPLARLRGGAPGSEPR